MFWYGVHGMASTRIEPSFSFAKRLTCGPMNARLSPLRMPRIASLLVLRRERIFRAGHVALRIDDVQRVLGGDVERSVSSAASSTCARMFAILVNALKRSASDVIARISSVVETREEMSRISAARRSSASR
jgi:hypothetical protein